MEGEMSQGEIQDLKKMENENTILANTEGMVVATYDIIHGIGWKPDASQQQPKARGSVPTGFNLNKSS